MFLACNRLSVLYHNSVSAWVTLQHMLFPSRATVCDVGCHVDWEAYLGPPIDKVPESSHELSCRTVSFHVEHLVSNSWLCLGEREEVGGGREGGEERGGM